MIVLDGNSTIETLEFMLHKWKVSPSCIITHSDDVNGEDIFSSSPELLAGSVRTAVEQKKIPECDIITVMSELLGKNHSAPVAEITSEGVKEIHVIN